MSTKPLIQQLAERIGWAPGNATLQAIVAAHAAPSFIFELCAYLDEQAASFPFCSTHDRAGGCDECEPPAPETISRAEQKRPPPPDELVDALHDPIHPPSGNLISASPVRVKRREPNAAYEQGQVVRVIDFSERHATTGIVVTSQGRAGKTLVRFGCAEGWYLHDEICAEEPESPAAPEVAKLPSWEDLLAGQRTARREYEALEQQLAQARADNAQDLAAAHAWRESYETQKRNHCATEATLKAELASRCDHHAAIHELNRELVEARAQLARVEGELENSQAERETSNRIIDRLNPELANSRKYSSELEGGIVKLQTELAKVTAERDELKAQLAWEKAWDLHTKVAMGAVVEAARAFCFAQKQVQVSMFGPHLLRAESARATALACLRETLDALTAAAAKPAEP